MKRDYTLLEGSNRRDWIYSPEDIPHIGIEPIFSKNSALCSDGAIIIYFREESGYLNCGLLLELL